MQAGATVATADDLPVWWRVTKYDPTLRDARGRYTAPTWTSISDVGASFGGVRLTAEEYERIETAYLDAARAFAESAGVTELQIRALDLGPPELKEGAITKLADAIEITRLMLREEAVCKLEAPANNFAIHVGFDYYMYIGATRALSRAEKLVRSRGLFVEPDWPSPQLASD